MRIKEIEIQNFKALYGKYTIELGNSGKNLMIYGENGSGKSSFCQALQLFFQSSQQEIDISTFKNVFNQNGRNSWYIKITFRDKANNRDKPNKRLRAARARVRFFLFESFQACSCA
ncbi:MAG: AAA family ATPase [Actinobacteria bacterium]|nr:AAA family ATPase [Actinomycetota bacterium]